MPFQHHFRLTYVLYRTMNWWPWADVDNCPARGKMPSGILSLWLGNYQHQPLSVHVKKINT